MSAKLSIFYKAFRILPRHARRRLLRFQFVILLGALVEIAGVTSIVPFMGLAMKPELIETNRWIHAVYTQLGFHSHNAFLIFLGAAFVALIVANNAISAYTTWASAQFLKGLSVDLGVQLLEDYLRRPYIWFLSQTSAKLGSRLMTEVSQFVNGFVGPVVRSVSKLLTSSLLIGALVWVDPGVAVVSMGILGGAYCLIYTQIRPRLAELGKQRVKWNRANFHVAKEALAGIQEIKLYQCENYVLTRFRDASARLAQILTTALLYTDMPRYLMESLAFSGIVGLVLYLIATRGDVANLLPILSLYAVASYRLMPAFQSLFTNLAKLRFNYAVVDVLHEDMYGDQKAETSHEDRVPLDAVKPMGLKNGIELYGISFTYPRNQEPTIRNLSLSIESCTSIGFVGGTGAGKTTLINIILGFLDHSHGMIQVDGVPITGDNLRNWQRTIGYVPQALYLINASVRQNIAFGRPEETIDDEKVMRAARIANIHDFVVNELPNGYRTIVGERGIRLSGGQRQRIAIARALYDDPEVLILDEATSALDGITELAVMEAMSTLSGSKTLILIAHRLTTVRNCDVIYMMEGGSVVARGKYEELMASNESFRAMAQALTV